MPEMQQPGKGMPKGRMEAFTDGVVAIIITIMVLELKVPAGHDFEALAASLPVCNCSGCGYVESTRGAPARARRIASRALMERRRAVSMTERMSA